MIAEHERRHGIFYALVLLFKYNGQILLEKLKIVSWSWVIINFLAVFHLMVLHAKKTYDEFKARNLESICDTAMATIIYGFSTFTFVYWISRQKALNEILEFIDRNQRERSLEGMTFVESVKANTTQRRLTVVWTVMCMAGVMSWGLVPLLSGKRVLPLNCWYPIETTTPVVYETLYFLQLFGQYGVGLAFGNGSGLFMALVIVLCGQLDVLFASLKNVYYQTDRMANKPLPEHECASDVDEYAYSEESIVTNVKPKFSVIDNTNYKIFLKRNFQKCIQHHQFILEAAKKFENLYFPYCWVKSMQVTIQLCFLAFLMVTSEKSVFRGINLLNYSSLTLLELLMFTYFGQTLKEQSVKVNMAFWRSNWYEHLDLIQKDILIFLINAKRPIVMSAGKFYPMDLSRFISVVTQAISFLTLLRKLDLKSS
ncbi:GPROR40 family protein [Megaselia abdita]